MKVKIINILKSILFFIILLFPLLVVFLIVFNAGWFNALPLAERYIAGFGVIVLTVAVLVFLPRTHLIDGALKGSFKKAEIKFEEWDEKNRKEIEYVPIDKTKYINTTKVYSQLNRVRGLFFIVPASIMLIYMILRSEQYNAVITFFLITATVLSYNYFGRIVKISPEGIRSASLFRNQFIKWDKIKTVGISCGAGKAVSDTFIWIYVSTRELKSKHLVVTGKDNKGFIVFKFRAKMIHHILCFYDNEIINLHNVRRWRRYIKSKVV